MGSLYFYLFIYFCKDALVFVLTFCGVKDPLHQCYWRTFLYYVNVFAVFVFWWLWAWGRKPGKEDQISNGSTLGNKHRLTSVKSHSDTTHPHINTNWDRNTAFFAVTVVQLLPCRGIIHLIIAKKLFSSNLFLFQC